MKILQHEVKWEGTYIINGETGELITIVPDKRKKSKGAPHSKVTGLDTKWPANCLTEDSLLEALSDVDGYINTKPWVNSRYLLESVSAECTTIQQLKLIEWVADHLSGWNYYIGSVKELREGTGIHPKVLPRVISSLGPYTLRVLHRGKPERGCIVLQVSPFIAWKGDKRIQQEKVPHWYSTVG